MFTKSLSFTSLLQTFIMAVCLFVFAINILTIAPQKAAAQSQSELRAMIEALLSQLAALQAQVASQSNTTVQNSYFQPYVLSNGDSKIIDRGGKNQILSEIYIKQSSEDRYLNLARLGVVNTSGIKKPWNTFDQLSIWLNGNELYSVDSDESDNWRARDFGSISSRGYDIKVFEGNLRIPAGQDYTIILAADINAEADRDDWRFMIPYRGVTVWTERAGHQQYGRTPTFVTKSILTDQDEDMVTQSSVNAVVDITSTTISKSFTAYEAGEADTVTAVISFEVTAKDEDVLVPARAGYNTMSERDLDFIIKGLSSEMDNDIDYSVSVSSGAEKINEFYLVNEGEIEAFRLKVTFTVPEDGYYTVRLNSPLKVFLSVNDNEPQSIAFNQDDATTDYISGTNFVVSDVDSPSCVLTTNKVSYQFGEIITLKWTSKNTRLSSFVQPDLTGKDNISVPTGSFGGSGQISLVANVSGNPTVTLRVKNSEGMTSDCTVRIPVGDSGTDVSEDLPEQPRAESLTDVVVHNSPNSDLTIYNYAPYDQGNITSKTTFTLSDTIQFKGVVQNKGTQSTGGLTDAQLHLDLQCDGKPDRYPGIDEVPALGAGERMVAQVNWKADTIGDHCYRFRVDRNAKVDRSGYKAPGRIDESNDNNNLSPWRPFRVSSGSVLGASISETELIQAQFVVALNKMNDRLTTLNSVLEN